MNVTLSDFMQNPLGDQADVLTPEAAAAAVANVDKESAGGTESSNITILNESAHRARMPKGSKPPLLYLDEAVEIAQEIYDRAGGSVSFDAFSQIINNSIASSSFQKKLADMRGYDLISTENKVVILTATAEKIVAPRSPQEKADALKAAFCGIEVFDQIYKKYAGRLLPEDVFLINVFKEHVPRDLAEKWMDRFKESATSANLLIDKGDGKLQVVEGTLLGNVTAAVENFIQDVKTEIEKKIDAPVEQQGHEHAMKTILLHDSKKNVWIGTDANMFQIKHGKDLNFVLKLIELFDKYERGEDVVGVSLNIED